MLPPNTAFLVIYDARCPSTDFPSALAASIAARVFKVPGPNQAIAIPAKAPEAIFATVKVSPKYQVVIPKEVRKKLSLHKGQKMVVMAKGDVILFMPAAPLKHYRGFLKGMNAQGIREKKDRL